MKKRIVVIGGSAAGPKAAAKARRMDENAEVVIFQKEADLVPDLPVRVQLSLLHAPLQPKQFGRRLGDVDVHGVHLLDRCQGRRLAGRHQGAFRDIGPPDAAGDGSLDRSVSQIDFGGLDRGLAILDVRLGLLQRRCRVVVVLTAFAVSSSFNRLAFRRIAWRLASDRLRAALALSSAAW